MLYKNREYTEGMSIKIMSSEKLKEKFGDIYSIPFGYNSNMDKYMGGCHVIRSIEYNSRYGILIRLHGNEWAWHPSEFCSNDISSLLFKGRLR